MKGPYHHSIDDLPPSTAFTAPLLLRVAPDGNLEGDPVATAPAAGPANTPAPRSSGHPGIPSAPLFPP